MALSWSGKRQLLYTAVGAVLTLGFLVGLWVAVFSKPSTCFDGTQNAGERGVDCGGACALICSADASAPVVLWYRAFEVAPGFYNAVAYIENKNVGAGARRVKYSFRLFDERNILVVERTGSTDIPPVSVVPIIESAISVGNRTVASTQFAFADETITWTKNTRVLPAVYIRQQNLARDGSRLSATLVNDSIEDVRGLTVTAVLFDASGVARAASKSTLPLLYRRSSQEVVFTWGSGTPNIVRAEITLLPAF